VVQRTSREPSQDRPKRQGCSLFSVREWGHLISFRSLGCHLPRLRGRSNGTRLQSRAMGWVCNSSGYERGSFLTLRSKGICSARFGTFVGLVSPFFFLISPFWNSRIYPLSCHHRFLAA
jgi:hypothetical protein